MNTPYTSQEQLQRERFPLRNSVPSPLVWIELHATSRSTESTPTITRVQKCNCVYTPAPQPPLHIQPSNVRRRDHDMVAHVAFQTLSYS
jgi:hypothetical protein